MRGVPFAPLDASPPGELIGNLQRVDVRSGACAAQSRVMRSEGFEAQHLIERGTEIAAPALGATVLIAILAPRRQVATDLFGSRRRLDAAADTFVLVPGGQASWWDNRGGGGPAIHTTFSASLLDELRSDEALSGPLPPRANWTNPALRHQVCALQTELSRSEPSGRLFAESLARMIGITMLRSATEGLGSGRCTGGLAGWQVRRVTEYLLSRLEEDVSLSELAAVAELSPSHFCRAFKAATGRPPHAWLADKRMERARELMLAYPQMGLTEVALAVGYQSQAAFGTAFKRAAGVSPSRWRRERRW